MPPPARPGWVLPLAAVAVAALVVGAFVAGLHLAGRGGEEGANRSGGGQPLGSDAGSGAVDGGLASDAPAQDAPAHDAPADDGVANDVPSGRLGINLVRATEVSCAHDNWGSGAADLVVTVKVDGREVLRAGSDATDAPLFGAFAAVDPKPGGSLVEVIVQDWEGGNAFAPCDVVDGPGTDAVFTWKGEETLRVFRGDGADVAEVVLKLGTPPLLLTRAWADSTSTSATFRWSSGGSVDSVKAIVYPGQVAGSTSGTSLTVTGLCDGMAYQARLVAVRGDWHIGLPVAFETANDHPEAPRVLSATAGSGMLRVEWDNPSPHDTQRFEVYVGPQGFQPSAATKRATDEFPGIHWSESASMRSESGDREVIVRTVDRHGLWTDSARFTIGGAERESDLMGKALCQGPGTAPGYP